MTNKAIRIVSLIAAIAVGGVPMAMAKATISKVSSISTVTYSPNKTVKTTASVTVKSNGYTGGVCVVFKLLSFLPAVAAPAGSPSFGLYQPAAAATYLLSLDGTPADANETLSFTFTQGGVTSKTLRYAAIVSDSPLPPPGSYTATLRADLYEGDYLLPKPSVDGKTITFSIKVVDHLDVSLVDPGADFDRRSTSKILDFGAIEEGDTRSAQLVVRTNRSYDLSLASTNGGLICSTDAASLVAYDLYLNRSPSPVPASPIALGKGSSARIATGAAATYDSWARYTLDFKIAEFTEFPSYGTYSDSVSVTLAAP